MRTSVNDIPEKIPGFELVCAGDGFAVRQTGDANAPKAPVWPADDVGLAKARIALANAGNRDLTQDEADELNAAIADAKAADNRLLADILSAISDAINNHRTRVGVVANTNLGNASDAETAAPQKFGYAAILEQLSGRDVMIARSLGRVVPDADESKLTGRQVFIRRTTGGSR